MKRCSAYHLCKYKLQGENVLDFPLDYENVKKNPYHPGFGECVRKWACSCPIGESGSKFNP